MKVEKKEGLKHIKVHHNKPVFWTIVVLFAVLLIILFSLRQIGNHQIPQNNSAEGCTSDADCVASSCCHASSCLSKNQAPACNGIMCSQECRENTLDCNQGSCAC